MIPPETNGFTELNLQPRLVETLNELGYASPTPIQSAVIPVMLTGQDVIGQAQTGTGKTAAFALPTLQNLVAEQDHVQILVLTPTRELAIQVAEAIYTYGRQSTVRVLPVYGGQSYSRQISRLKKGVDIVVGTPGRLLDLIRRQALDLSQVSTVVLDEADEMLSMGFIEDIELLLDETPTPRQTALFSATVPPRIRRLADRYMHQPQSFSIKCEQLTVDTIDQRYYLVNEMDKLAALTRLFEVEPISSALIFVRTRLGTGTLADNLTERGFPAEALNGNMNQEARVQTLNRFRDNKIKVLVATDVAARGLDIDDISHVFNYDLPSDPEVYVHRIGRTGRAGKTGIAISLLAPQEGRNLRKIEAYIKQKLTASTLPTVEAIQTHREEQLVQQVMVWLKRGRCRREKEIVADLVTQGHDPLEIAAIALKLARKQEKHRPIAPINELHPETKHIGKKRNKKSAFRGADKSSGTNHSHEAGMIRLTLNTGKIGWSAGQSCRRYTGRSG